MLPGLQNLGAHLELREVQNGNVSRRFEIALAIATLAFLACRQVIGIEPREEGDPPVRLGEACGACVASECDAAERACAADEKCAAAAECLAGAGLDNPTGRIACLSEHAQASITPALRALDQCMRSPCQDVCYGRAGYFAAYGEECVGCTETECGDSMAACVRDPHCESLAVDALADGSIAPPALGRLFNAPGDAGQEERGMSDCSFNCNERCGFDGRDLACLGAYAWPLEVESGEASLELEVKAVVDSTLEVISVPGATCELCAFAPCEVVASATADASGIGHISTKLNYPQGFRGFARLTGELDGEPLVPTHAFVYPVLEGARGGAILLGRTFFEQLTTLNAGGAIPGKAHLFINVLDCRLRRAPGITLRLPPDKTSDASITYLNGEGATSDDGVVFVWNVDPGCYDLVGASDGVETHRMRVQAEPDVVSGIFLVPKADPPDQGSSCAPN